jgi:hypothetical protein
VKGMDLCPMRNYLILFHDQWGTGSENYPSHGSPAG